MALNTNFTTGQVLTSAQTNNFPRGAVASPIVDTSLNFNPVTIADIAGLTFTFNAVANRFYRVSYSFFASCSTANDTSLRIEYCDAANVVIQQSIFKFPGAVAPEGQYYLNVFYEKPTTSGSVTRKLRAARQVGAGTITIFSNLVNLPFCYAIEDCGST